MRHDSQQYFVLCTEYEVLGTLSPARLLSGKSIDQAAHHPLDDNGPMRQLDAPAFGENGQVHSEDEVVLGFGRRTAGDLEVSDRFCARALSASFSNVRGDR